MGSANKHHRSKPKFPNKNPSTSSDTEDRNPNPNLDLHLMDSETAAIPPLTINGAEEDAIFSKSEYLTREEVIRRRSRRVKQLEKIYRDHYWALMEKLRLKYREYYWKYGKSPFKEESEMENGGEVDRVVEGNGEINNHNNSNNRLGLGFGENGSCDGKIKKCAFGGCKSKAMALTNFCHPHILSDSKQKLYKACKYVIKSAQTRPIHCGKPILRSTVPSLCTLHFQKAEKHVTRALKKAGLNVSSSSKLAPKFHVIVAESVKQINARRRDLKANVGNVVVKEETAG